MVGSGDSQGLQATNGHEKGKMIIEGGNLQLSMELL